MKRKRPMKSRSRPCVWIMLLYLAFAILLVLTGIVKTSPAENKVMREQRAVQQQMDTNGTNMKDLMERLKMLEMR